VVLISERGNPKFPQMADPADLLLVQHWIRNVEHILSHAQGAGIRTIDLDT
jgi:hypothetical protein